MLRVAIQLTKGTLLIELVLFSQKTAVAVTPFFWKLSYHTDVGHICAKLGPLGVSYDDTPAQDKAWKERVRIALRDISDAQAKEERKESSEGK